MHTHICLLKCSLVCTQITVWPLAVLSNCSKDGGSCPLVDVGSAAFTKLASSDDTVTAVMAGYPAPLTGAHWGTCAYACMCVRERMHLVSQRNVMAAQQQHPEPCPTLVAAHCQEHSVCPLLD